MPCNTVNADFNWPDSGSITITNVILISTLHYTLRRLCTLGQFLDDVSSGLSSSTTQLSSPLVGSYRAFDTDSCVHYSASGRLSIGGSAVVRWTREFIKKTLQGRKTVLTAEEAAFRTVFSRHLVITG